MRTLHFGPSSFFFQPHLPERNTNIKKTRAKRLTPYDDQTAQSQTVQDGRRRAWEQPPATGPAAASPTLICQ